MAGHHYLVVEDTPDYTCRVYNVSYPRGAQPQPPPNVVKAAYLPGRVAAQGEGYAAGIAKPLESLNAVGTNADNYGISCGELFLGVAKLPRLDSSTGGKSHRIKVQDHIETPVFGKRKLPSGLQGDREIRSRGFGLEHDWFKLPVCFVECQQQVGHSIHEAAAGERETYRFRRKAPM